MKKVLGLVMALVMILTAVSAFAATPSKTTKNLTKVTTEDETVKVIITTSTNPAVLALIAALTTNNAIPADAKAALPEGSTATKVEELITLRIEGGTAEKDLIANLMFPTSYAGKTVDVLLGVLEGEKIAGWKCVKGTGKTDGSIDIVLSGALQDWLNGREFIAMVVD